MPVQTSNSSAAVGTAASAERTDAPVIPASETSVALSPQLARSVSRTAARSRLERELRSIAVDLLGGSNPGELPDDCGRWLATTVDAAIAGVCDASLRSLLEALDAQLAVAPPPVARRLADAELRHDAGYG